MADAPNLISALAAAQAEMRNATFNRINPHFKNQYADLSAIRDATIPALSKHGLAVVQFTSFSDGQLLLHTRIAHKSGEYIEGVYPLPTDLSKPQAMGSAMTYAKRYCWSSMCGIAADDDDDAETAQSANVQQKTAHKARKEAIWESLQKEMLSQPNAEALRKWAINNQPRIYEMPDNWQLHFREEYERRMTEFREGVTEEGSTVKEQLRQSVEELIDDEIPDHKKRVAK